jgi:predicted RNA-binding Zn ribbon-like protein
MGNRVLDREPGSGLPLNDQLRFDAGSAALNLLATVGQRRSRHPVDRLTSAGRLGDWLAGAGLPAVPVTADDLAAARDLRETGYRILASPALLARADVETLSAWSSRPVPGPSLLLVAGQIKAEEPPATITTVLADLARELVRLATAGDERLRACDGPECGMLYLDTSRGRRRRWCSMARCGNIAKVGRFRESAGAER